MFVYVKTVFIKESSMKKFGGLMYLLCMLILSGCSGDACKVDGKMSDFSGETTVYLLRRTGEFTHDTLMQTVMKDGSFRLEIPRDLWGYYNDYLQKIQCTDGYLEYDSENDVWNEVKNG